ncbi:MAG: hypothetical protein ABI778_05040 [Ignavibacteriota bacterium]
MQNVTIPLDTDVANFYLNASEQDKVRMQWLLNLWMKKKVMEKPRRSLREIMDEAGKYAEESGLTPEIFNEIINDK